MFNQTDLSTIWSSRFMILKAKKYRPGAKVTRNSFVKWVKAQKKRPPTNATKHNKKDLSDLNEAEF